MRLKAYQPSKYCRVVCNTEFYNSGELYSKFAFILFSFLAIMRLMVEYARNVCLHVFNWPMQFVARRWCIAMWQKLSRVKLSWWMTLHSFAGTSPVSCFF